MTDGRELSLRIIGYWRSDHEPQWPDVHDFVDPDWDRRERDVVVGHLYSGMRVRQFMGFSTCRFCGEPNGTSESTDGKYVWPEGLAHYLLEHNVRLPAEFVEHALANRIGWPPVDASWWLTQQSME
jgi:hypothetical protein